MKKKNPPAPSSDTPEQKKSDYGYVVANRKARAATKHRKAITVVGIIILILLLIFGGIYAFYAAVQANNFKIFVEPSGSKRLSLSPHKTMMPASEMIELVGPEKMTNTTLAKGKNLAGSVPIEDSLPKIAETEGSFTTIEDFYIAGTFYMRNITNNEMLYGERITFSEIDDGAYNSLRVMLIRNDEIKVYAAPRADGTPEAVVPIRSGYTKRSLQKGEDGIYSVIADDSDEIWYSEMFDSKEFAVKNDNISIAPGEIVKYSVIIWFEGWDEDCVDDVIGSTVEMTLSFCCN